MTKSVLLRLMTVMLNKEICFYNQSCSQRNLIKDTTNLRNMKKIIVGYTSPRHIKVGCTKSMNNIRITEVHQLVLFLQGHAKTQLTLALHFVNMKGRKDLSHKECFAMFLTYCSRNYLQIKTCFCDILILNGKKATQIMDSWKLLFEAKQITLEKVLFIVLDGTNAMSGKQGGLHRKIQHYSPFNIYVIVIQPFVYPIS